MARGIASGLFAIGMAAALSGCTSMAAVYARDPGLMVEGGEGFQFDDPEIAESFALTGQMRFPARLAVHGLERNRFGLYADARVAQFETALAQDAEHFSEILPLPEFLMGRGCSSNVTVLRRAAARTHADAILLYQQDVKTEEDASVLRLLNVTVVAAWLVPSTWWQIQLDTTAALVDVRNGHVYFTVHDVRAREGFSPSARVEDRALVVKSELREESFEALRDAVAVKLARIRGGDGSEPR